MKKIILVALILLMNVQNSYADTQIDKALECLKSINDTRTLDIIKGNNFTNQPIDIVLIDSYDIPCEYRKALAITNIEYDNSYVIYINGRLRNSPPEAIACLIAHEATHVTQGVNTKEEEVTAWTHEATTWQKLISINKDLTKGADELTSRENSLVKDLTGSKNGIRKRVYNNPMYLNIK